MSEAETMLVVTVTRADGTERRARVDVERLQEVMDKAAVEFFDPSRPQTPSSPPVKPDPTAGRWRS